MRALASVVALLLYCAGSALAGPQQPAFAGRGLEEALRALQRSGLPIIFSSETVTPAMRVGAEPSATDPRQQLDELLAPHLLTTQRGPGGVILVVRARPVTARNVARVSTPERNGRRPGDAETTVPRENPAYVERVTVTGSRSEHFDRGGSATTFDAIGLQSNSSILQDDGLGAVHAMPNVAGVDDFRNEFSVRGSPPRHIGVVIDGVATPWLQHAVYGRREAGVLSMFGAGILEQATLQAGAYPRRYGDSLGAQLELTVREGSRQSKYFTGSLGGMSAGFVGEGPIGADARGSWIVSVRNSYRSWPARRPTPTETGFQFTDAQAKLVYDVTPAQQFSMTAMAGRSTVDAADEPFVGPLAAGTNHAALFTIQWRSTLRSRTAIRQRVSFVGQGLVNTQAADHTSARSANQAFGYRADALHPLFSGTLEAGGELRQLAGIRDSGVIGPTLLSDRFDATWATRSAYANFGRTIARGVWLSGGLRLSESTLVRDRAVVPWMLGEWSIRPGWMLNVSAGASRQFPELDAVGGAMGSPDLVAERATHLDVGIERRLTPELRLRATWFQRVERDGLRAPNLQPRLVHGIVFDPGGLDQYQSSLRGTSRGVELLVARGGVARVSGWMSYSYGTTRQTDTLGGESFWSEFDRRHALNVAGVFRMSDRTNVGVVFRGASGIPIQGYFAARHGSVFIGERPNEVRLSPYARLDARAQRTFVSSGRRVTLFAEVLNVLNRENQGPADGFVQPLTGEATGFSRPLLPRRVSVGVEVGLSR